MGSHAYAVLQIVEVGGTRFVKLQNPHGTSEWSGAWARGAKEWKEKFGRQVKRAVGYPKRGTFVMTWEDFNNYFDQVWFARDLAIVAQPRLVSKGTTGRAEMSLGRAEIGHESDLLFTARANFPGRTAHRSVTLKVQRQREDGTWETIGRKTAGAGKWTLSGRLADGRGAEVMLKNVPSGRFRLDVEHADGAEVEVFVAAPKSRVSSGQLERLQAILRSGNGVQTVRKGLESQA